MGKKPHLQNKILKSIALNGTLSQKQAADELLRKPSTISEAFRAIEKLITEVEIIEVESLDPKDRKISLERKIRQEKFYKLSTHGLLRFIEEDHDPYEFWAAVIWYGTLNSKSAKRDEFNRHYNQFIQKFIGDHALRSCFFLGGFFEYLFLGWRKEYFESRNDYTAIYIYTEAVKAYKVLECLLRNRGITVDKIVKSTKLVEQDVRKVIEDHSMTQSIYSQFIDEYEIVSRSSRSVDTTLRLLNHLLIVGVGTKSKERYELSLLGVLLTLALISLKRQEEDNTYIDYYNRAASNYREKLPLIFGKWELLEKNLDFSAYPSLLDYLLGDYKSKLEILSLPVSLGGNKEIYENIRSSTLNTMNKYSMVYDGGIHALEYADYPDKFRDTLYFRLIQEKINEIETSLKYTDLKSFGKYMKDKKKSESNSARISVTFEDDLHFIENALADEFSFLFYVGLIRENIYRASDYPLTTDFIRSNPGGTVPKDLLYKIIASDDEIHNKLKELIIESKSYQTDALKKIDDIHRELNDEKK